VVSPASRHRAVNHLVDKEVSRVRACRVAGLSRSCSRISPTERNPGLRARILDLAAQNPRYGFRRVHALLSGVNLKAVHRIWRAEGLRLKRRPRRRLNVPRNLQPTLT
jgi:putative transposase